MAATERQTYYCAFIGLPVYDDNPQNGLPPVVTQREADVLSYFRPPLCVHNVHFGGGILKLVFNFPPGNANGEEMLRDVILQLDISYNSYVRMNVVDMNGAGFSHQAVLFHLLRQEALGANWYAMLAEMSTDNDSNPSGDIDFTQLLSMTVTVLGQPQRRNRLGEPLRIPGDNYRVNIIGGCPEYERHPLIKQKTNALCFASDHDNNSLCGLIALAYFWMETHLERGGGMITLSTRLKTRAYEKPKNTRLNFSNESHMQYFLRKTGHGMRKKLTDELLQCVGLHSEESIAAQGGLSTTDLSHYLGVICHKLNAYYELRVWSYLVGELVMREKITPTFKEVEYDEDGVPREDPPCFNDSEVKYWDILHTSSANNIPYQNGHWVAIRSLKSLAGANKTVCLNEGCFRTYRVDIHKSGCPGCNPIKCRLCHSRLHSHEWHAKTKEPNFRELTAAQLGELKEKDLRNSALYLETKQCPVCNIDFHDPACYETHLFNERCNEVRKCLDCGVKFTRTPASKANHMDHCDFSHTCGEYKCSGCGEKVTSTEGSEHFCVIKPLSKSKMKRSNWTKDCETVEEALAILEPLVRNYSKNVRGSAPNRVEGKRAPALPNYDKINAERKYLKRTIIFADFEATTDNDNLEHLVNFVCSEDQDGVKLPVFKDVASWLTYIFDRYTDGATIIMHNGGGYDFQFILPQIKLLGLTIENLSMAGTRIKCFQAVGSVKTTYKNNGSLVFLDSASFLAMKLADFAKTFNLPSAKGHFPHGVNSDSQVILDYLENLNGDCPAPEYFGIAWMSVDEKAELLEWIEERNDRSRPDWKPWIYADEMRYYCEQDVTVLRLGWQKFSAIVEESTRVEEEDDEGKVTKYWGMWPHDSFTIPSMAMRMWGLYFNDAENNPLPRLPETIHEDLIEAMAGGRTEPVALAWKQKEGEPPAQYIDFTSLYPYVNKTKKIPIGHPLHVTVQTEEEEGVMDLDAIYQMFFDEEGNFEEEEKIPYMVLEVDVKCPQDLHLPLLHEKIPGENKLMFTLRTKTKMKYTSIELLNALFLGYEITKIHQAWYWAEASNTVFAGYVNKWLKLKQEAAGLPAERDMKEYIADYLENEGVELDPENIKPTRNKGIYVVAKFLLNSLWGKYGQKLRYTSKIMLDGCNPRDCLIWDQLVQGLGYHSEPQEWSKDVPHFPLPAGCVLKENMVVPLDPRFLLVGYTQDKLKMEESRTTAGKNRHPENPYVDHIQRKYLTRKQCAQVAIFTTAHARVWLYKLLHFLGDRVLYYDTDSVVFAPRKGEDPSELAPLGKYLGDLTNELADDFQVSPGEEQEYKGDATHYDPNHGICEWLSGGPKHYCYKLTNGKIVLKVKGVRTKRDAVRTQLNMDDMRRAIFEGVGKTIVDSEIRKENFRVYTHNTQKFYRCVTTKRRRMHNDDPDVIMTEPWTDETNAELQGLCEQLKQDTKERNVGVKRPAEPTDNPWNILLDVKRTRFA